ncbi:ribonuclease HII [Bdellovibrio sp. ArHS]|uniref:ribonuclease HII n=1 Tax=Bdellovibrio sp. ArHS TaxID=1569284 RepID=UPI000AD596D9|nr:ribonuclease HII [Bdellovibrio sp. ArHS]
MVVSKKTAAKKITLKKAKPKKTFKKEEYPKVNWREFFPEPVIGVDEVGRGCLAGPVYAAAVIFKSDALAEDVTDSKLLSEERREELATLIHNEHHVGIGFATVEEIDEMNILRASLLAMKRAVEALGVKGGHVLIDGNMKIPGLEGFEQTTMVKGDLRVAPISAASIVAKVTRDRLMKQLGEKYPLYGFEVHKGYSTPVHKDSIVAHGPCRVHRKSFAGVKEHLADLIVDEE